MIFCFMAYKGYQYEIRNKKWADLPALLGFQFRGNISEYLITQDFWNRRNSRFIQVEAVNEQTFQALKCLPAKDLNVGKPGEIRIKFKRTERNKSTGNNISFFSW